MPILENDLLSVSNKLERVGEEARFYERLVSGTESVLVTASMVCSDLPHNFSFTTNQPLSSGSSIKRRQDSASEVSV